MREQCNNGDRPEEVLSAEEAEMAQTTKSVNFTPGPWSRSQIGGHYPIYDGHSAVPAATVHERMYFTGEGTANANAHLIAAAPELYSELERLDPENPTLRKARGES